MEEEIKNEEIPHNEEVAQTTQTTEETTEETQDEPAVEEKKDEE